MNNELLNGLILYETDVDGAMRRLSGDDVLYISLLDAFVEDDTMKELEAAVSGEQWDKAFTAAHALKGLAGNMGFIPLFHETGELVMLIRTGKTREIDTALKEVRRCYNDIVSVIRCNNIDG